MSNFSLGVVVVAILAGVGVILMSSARPQPGGGGERNLAGVAKASTSYVSPHETIDALNDGFDPKHSNDKSHGAYGNWPRKDIQWVQYEWTQPISTAKIAVYWFDDHGGVRLPKVYLRLELK